MYGCEGWTVKKAERRRIDAFELWCWRRLLRDPWTSRRSNQLILKEINPEYSLEGLVLKPKLQYFGHLVQRTDSLGLHRLQCARPPVHHQLLEITQTHVHQFSDAIQPSQPLSSSSPPAFNFSQHQNFFQWVSSSHQVAKVLEFQLQHASFQWIFRMDFL